jgi:hypothetical protein
MKLDRRTFIAASSAVAAIPSRLPAAPPGQLTPEDFGALGDGKTNDTRAFVRLSDEVNRRGGGTISLGAGRTYIIGAQSPLGQYGWNGAPILELHDLKAPLTIIGNGARLRCQPGLKFGTFDPLTGAPSKRPLPNVRLAELASPYLGMIYAHDCSGPIEISDVELDGNIERLRIGGKFGDTGWQVPAAGLFLVRNSGAEIVRNVLSHHHGTDGVMIVGSKQRTIRSLLSNVRSRYNGRLGLSITAGHAYDFADCEFSHSGRTVVQSAPGAGVDIEAETAPIRDLSFTRCKFIDNMGAGMVADSGDSENARFTGCLFVGTTNWSIWPHKPRFSFASCTFVGSIASTHEDDDHARATRFVHCRFTDDPKLSPTGKVYTSAGPIADLSESRNVLFDGCRFDLVGAGRLPQTTKAIYRDCVMSQRSPKTGEPEGRYFGRNIITGHADLNGSMIEGVVIVNGERVPRGIVGHGKPW